MIGYLHGRVIALYTDHCLLDVHGVGYRVFVANSTRTKLRQREEASLFIYTSVREDAIVLYGFAAEEEYDLFLQLIGVSGIGPKVALGILSAITVEGLCRAIQNKQASVLTKLPGIGKKSATTPPRRPWPRCSRSATRPLRSRPSSARRPAGG